MSSSILFVLTGGVFRTNNFNEKEIIKRQLLTARSHIKLIEHIKTKYNIDVKILFNISSTNHNNHLYKIYEKYILEKNEFIENESELELIQKTVKAINKINLNNFKYLFYLRADCYLKEHFITIFKVVPDKVVYSFIDKGYHNFNYFENFPSINHSIILIPHKFFYMLDTPDMNYKEWFFYHSGADRVLMKESSRNVIDFFDYNLYFTITNHCWNPLYFTCDKPECRTTTNKILTFKITENKVLPNKKFKDYIEFYEIDNEKNKNILKNEEDFSKLVNMYTIPDTS